MNIHALNKGAIQYIIFRRAGGYFPPFSVAIFSRYFVFFPWLGFLARRSLLQRILQETPSSFWAGGGGGPKEGGASFKMLCLTN